MKTYINYIDKRLLEESLDDYYYDYYQPAIDNILDEFRNRNENETQKWKVVPFSLVNKIWNDFSKYGVVQNERGLDNIVEQIIKNIARLQVNTMLAGHSSEDPTEYVENAGIDVEDFEENFGDFILDDGQWRISDYGLDKLVKLADQLLDSKDYTEKLLLIDQVFNVTHQRSDLAKLFIQGGISSLNKLAGF